MQLVSEKITPERIRTSDFLLRRQALYPLSYGRSFGIRYSAKPGQDCCVTDLGANHTGQAGGLAVADLSTYCMSRQNACQGQAGRDRLYPAELRALFLADVNFPDHVGTSVHRSGNINLPNEPRLPCKLNVSPDGYWVKPRRESYPRTTLFDRPVKYPLSVRPEYCCAQPGDPKREGIRAMRWSIACGARSSGAKAS